MKNIAHAVERIRQIGVFDETWYRQAYPDVDRLGLEPIEHYVRFGASLRRAVAPGLIADAPAEALRVAHNGSDLELLVESLERLRSRRQNEGRKNSSPPLAARPTQSRELRLPRPIERKLPLTALVIAWDVGHNPLGRAYMLAEVLDRVVRNVVIAGFQFPRYGSGVWEPLQESRIPVIRLPTANFPEFLDRLEEISERTNPDIVFACKARLPSVQLGLMIKKRTGCPLIIDIDDHELSFFQEARELGLADLEAMKDGDLASEVEPYSATWTGLAYGLRHYADEILVSNPALQEIAGGTIIPHVRDETLFDPSRHDKATERDRYGVPRDAKVVLFFGTPRAHKGIQVLAEAIGTINDPTVRLVIVGTATDRRDVSRVKELARGRVDLIPNQPFERIPNVVAMADIVCLPQDAGSLVSKYQLPAKAIDAIAMSVPLLVIPTDPLGPLIESGLAVAVAKTGLPDGIREALFKERTTSEAAARNRYLAEYSYAAMAEKLHGIVRRVTDGRGRKELPGEFARLVSEQLRVLAAKPKKEAPRPGRDIVVFWKQNDTTLYGRRHDMVIKYLASRPDVRKVIVFDAPISEHDLVIRRSQINSMTHDRLIYKRTYERSFGLADSEKIKYSVFVHRSGLGRAGSAGGPSELVTLAACHVDETLQREGVDPGQAVFWFYPKVIGAEYFVDRFEPWRLVVDVVDDHRAWPGIKPEEKNWLTEHYKWLLQRASMSFANCAPVQCSMSEFTGNMRLVPNGCDYPITEPPALSCTAFNKLCGFTGKIIGYVGNLEKKIDIDLIRKVAQRFPDCMIVLVGSTHANPAARELMKIDNIEMPGVVPYDEVGAWISRFDVGMIPHLHSELTQNMNPLKLYVYLARGIPVVSTEIENVDSTTSAVYVAQCHLDFLSRIDHVIHQNVDKQMKRELATYLSKNSWTERLKWHVDELLCPLA